MEKLKTNTEILRIINLIQTGVASEVQVITSDEAQTEAGVQKLLILKGKMLVLQQILNSIKP